MKILILIMRSILVVVSRYPILSIPKRVLVLENWKIASQRPVVFELELLYVSGCKL